MTSTDKNPLSLFSYMYNMAYEPKLDTNTLFTSLATAAKSLQLCLTVCNPIDGSSLGSAVPGILQARILEWVAISSPNAWKWKVKVKLLSRIRLFATPWTAAYQASPSMGFSRQGYWSGMPSPSPIGDSFLLAFVEKMMVWYKSNDIIFVLTLDKVDIQTQVWAETGFSTPITHFSYWRKILKAT